MGISVDVVVIHGLVYASNKSCLVVCRPSFSMSSKADSMELLCLFPVVFVCLVCRIFFVVKNVYHSSSLECHLHNFFTSTTE